MTSSLFSPDQALIAAVGAVIATAAEREILPRFKTLGLEAVRHKSHPGDLVTDADLAAEALLTAELPPLLPGSLVVGEEATFKDNSVLDRLAGPDPVWVIDPVDGTSNFAHGRPTFGVIVALVQHGQTLAGWIYDPLKSTLYTALRGQGAWCNGHRLSVAGQGLPLADMTGSPGFRPNKALEGRFAHRLHHASAAHDYIALITGRMHFALFRRLMPWDHAAGVLLHQEAGGYCRLTEGPDYAPTLRSGSLLLTPDSATWNTLYSLLKTA